MADYSEIYKQKKEKETSKADMISMLVGGTALMGVGYGSREILSRGAHASIFSSMNVQGNTLNSTTIAPVFYNQGMNQNIDFYKMTTNGPKIYNQNGFGKTINAAQANKSILNLTENLSPGRGIGNIAMPGLFRVLNPLGFAYGLYTGYEDSGLEGVFREAVNMSLSYGHGIKESQREHIVGNLSDKKLSKFMQQGGFTETEIDNYLRNRNQDKLHAKNPLFLKGELTQKREQLKTLESKAVELKGKAEQLEVKYKAFNESERFQKLPAAKQQEILLHQKNQSARLATINNAELKAIEGSIYNLNKEAGPPINEKTKIYQANSFFRIGSFGSMKAIPYLDRGLGLIAPAIGSYVFASAGYSIGSSLAIGASEMLGADNTLLAGVGGGIFGASALAPVGAMAFSNIGSLAVTAAVAGSAMLAVSLGSGIMGEGFKRIGEAHNRFDFAKDPEPFFSRNAVTMRQRALQSMSGSHMNARNALGNEAAVLHTNRDYFATFGRL
jgi:hypothetical protein